MCVFTPADKIVLLCRFLGVLHENKEKVINSGFIKMKNPNTNTKQESKTLLQILTFRKNTPMKKRKQYQNLVGNMSKFHSLLINFEIIDQLFSCK